MASEAPLPAAPLSLRPGPVAARIGAAVRLWRTEAAISEAALAAALHLSVDAVRACEDGDPCFSAEQIVTLCHAFAVKPSRFLDGLV